MIQKGIVNCRNCGLEITDSGGYWYHSKNSWTFCKNATGDDSFNELRATPLVFNDYLKEIDK